MADVRRVNADAHYGDRRMAEQRSGGERGCQSHSSAACPGDDRPSRKLLTSSRRPDFEMIFRERYRRFLERLERALSIKPCRCNEPVDRSSDYIFDERTPFKDPSCSFFSAKTQELAFACRHQAGFELIGGAPMAGTVAVIETVEEHFDAIIGPGSEARGEWRARYEWGIAPMIGHHQHCDPLIHMRAQEIDELVHLGFKAW